MAELIQANCSEITFTETPNITCDGPQAGRHPRVFLTLKGGVEGEVVCPYCSHTFRLKEEERLPTKPKTRKTTARKKAPRKRRA